MYTGVCPTRFPYQMMCASVNSNTTGVTWGTGTLSPSVTTEFSPVFSGVLIASSGDSSLRITPLVFSNFSYIPRHLLIKKIVDDS